MRAIPARLLALLAALVLLLPSAASTRTQYYCRMMGRIIDSVGCNDGARSKATSPIQRLQREDCCQRLSSANRSASLGTQNAVIDVAPGAEVAAAFHPCPDRLNRDPVSFCAESTQAPLAIGPPLFIVHCALLS